MKTKNAQHTKGPWQIGGFGRIYSDGLMPSTDGSLPTAFEVARVPFRPSDALGITESASEANARLIAAAPEMYQALLAFQEGLRDGSIRWAKPRQADSDPYHKANTLACEAIAKAEGRE